MNVTQNLPRPCSLLTSRPCSDLVLSESDPSTGYVTVRINKPKMANAFDRELLLATDDALTKLKDDENVKGVRTE